RSTSARYTISLQESHLIHRPSAMLTFWGRPAVSSGLRLNQAIYVSEGGFAPLPTVVARLTARSSVPPASIARAKLALELARRGCLSVALNSPTFSTRAAVLEWASIVRTMAEPPATPSARLPTLTTCPGVEP